MDIKYYKDALNLMHEIGLGSTEKYFKNKTEKDGFEILKEALFTAASVSNQEINWVIRNLEIRFFPEKLKEYNISKPEPISSITSPLEFPALDKAISHTQNLLNAGALNDSAFEHLSIEIGAAIGETDDPEFTEALFEAKVKQKKVAQELIDRLNMLKEIKPYRLGLFLTLSGEINRLKNQSTGGNKNWKIPTYKKVKKVADKANELLKNNPDFYKVKENAKVPNLLKIEVAEDDDINMYESTVYNWLTKYCIKKNGFYQPKNSLPKK